MSSQAGSRKQITYAHKRNRSKPTGVVSASSPLPEIEDPDHYMSHTELSRRLLKRARRSSNPEPFSSKKLKPSGVTPSGSPVGSPPSQYYETPHPSALTEEQKFKLNSSRGLPVNPDQFSPLPASHRIFSRTGSRNLKENASHRAHKKGKLLDSPFNSRPSSTASSPQKSHGQSAAAFEKHATQKLPKRTLSDTHYNPNIPQSASTTTSPIRAHSPIRARRPSAPSPLRPGHWIPKDTAAIGSFDFDFHSALVNPFSLPSTVSDIDFNRPPSSLSCYGDADSQFFDDVQGISTPATKKRAYTHMADDDDDDELQEPDLTITQDDMDVVSVGMKVIPTRERSPWLSDSLISPPASHEWAHPPQEGASTSQDVDMDDDSSLHLGRAPGFVPDGGASGDGTGVGERDLSHVFDGLALATKNRFITGRTRSLDSAPDGDDEVHPKPKGRDRRGTIRASDFKNSVPPARRTRSGTVIGPPTTLQRTRSFDGGEVNEEEELGEWCADGWVVAAPPSPVVTRKRPRTMKDASDVHSPERRDELDVLSGLLPSPVFLLKNTSAVAKDIAVVMEEDEEEDELLLKPGFNVWE
ncbi:hypothetical protein C8R47DRAFT_102816 [Mycena vitilis]|nr:hypothetical protein C8R47DRAFT_102816 [Mycena vitilis]